MKNIYDGVVRLDARGEATVRLPDWFEALNRDFRYQLTPVGAPASGLFIRQEIKKSRFRIAGGTPGLKVSWQVTGIRHDTWARANRIPVEQAKSATEKRVETPQQPGRSARAAAYGKMARLKLHELAARLDSARAGKRR